MDKLLIFAARTAAAAQHIRSNFFSPRPSLVALIIQSVSDLMIINDLLFIEIGFFLSI